jgi:hypothetical protein
MLIADYQPPEPPPLAFIESEVRRRDDGKWLLMLMLRRNDLKPLFSHLVTDLVDIAGNASRDDAPNKLITRLGHWQKLLSRSPSGVLEDHELRGLLAELRFLQFEAVPIRQALPGLTAWKGPDRGTRDFRFPDVEVEIKAITRTGKTVTISSIEQLSDAVVPVILAAGVVELFDDPLGAQSSVADFVAQLRKLLEANKDAQEMFETKLARAGYADLPAYSERFVSFGPLGFYLIKSEFPRLNRPALHAGIVSATYDVSIQSLEPFRVRHWTVKTEGETDG